MKKHIKRIVGVIAGVSMLAGISTVSFAATEPDNKVSVSVEFEKAEYFPGETATAYLKVADVADEVAAGYKIGTFETGIKFDKTKLGFSSAEYQIVSDGADNCSIAPSTEVSNSDVIVALFYNGAGADITAQADGSFVLAKIYFDVLSAAQGEATVNIDDTYDSMFILPKSQSYTEMECETAEADKMNITSYKYIIESNGATATDTSITDTVTVRKKNDQVANAQLIAGIYEQNGKMLLSRVVIKNVGVDQQPYNISIPKPAVAAGTQLEVRYYLWNTTAIVSPLTPKKIVTVK